MPPPAPGCGPCAARDEENAQLREQLTARDAEVTGLRGQVADLKDRIARLERAVSRNSGNSSMPPSGMTRRAASRPASSGGRQNATPRRSGTGASSRGRCGVTWTVPDDTFDYYPEGTCACGADLGEPDRSRRRAVLPAERGPRAEGSDDPA